jgi:CheY-like chemotaxis protein
VKRLLIVDDDPMILEVTEMSLELAGWSVVSANDGHEALEKAAAERPDAILMDVMMPGMDGPTTCERLSATPETAHIPVILLTAKVQPFERRRWEDLPVAGVLAKPFDPLRLADDVRALLGWD